MSEQPPPYNPTYTTEKTQMAGPQVVPGMQTNPQQQYPPAGQQQYGGQQYPPPGQQYPPPGQQYPPPGQQPYQPPPQQQPYPVAGQQQHPPTGHAHQTVIVQQPGMQHVVVGAPKLGPSPMTMTCGTCNKLITTRTESSACSGMAWLICGIICLVGLFAGGITWLGCCLIPFCIPDLYDVTHYCPSCNTQLGFFRRMG